MEESIGSISGILYAPSKLELTKAIYSIIDGKYADLGKWTHYGECVGNDNGVMYFALHELTVVTQDKSRIHMDISVHSDRKDPVHVSSYAASDDPSVDEYRCSGVFIANHPDLFFNFFSLDAIEQPFDTMKRLLSKNRLDMLTEVVESMSRAENLPLEMSASLILNDPIRFIDPHGLDWPSIIGCTVSSRLHDAVQALAMEAIQ